MKRQLQLKTFKAALMLVVFLFMSFFGTEGTLVCFGSDGHVAIEIVDACHGSDFGSQVKGVESDECGPCSDFQLLGSTAYTRNFSQHAQALVMSASPMPLSLPPNVLPNHINSPDFSHHKTLASLHSVILRI